MPAPLAVDKEAVRVLVVEVGPREAARRMKLSENTVCAWSDRYGWLEDKAILANAIIGAPTPARTAIAATLPPSMRPVIPESHASGAISPANALKDLQAEDSQACRSAVLRGGRRVLESWADRAEDEPEAALAAAGDVASLTGAVAKAANWGANGQTNVRISMFAPQQVIDIEALPSCGTDVEQA